VGLIDEFSEADSGTVGSVKKLVLQRRFQAERENSATKHVEPTKIKEKTI